MEKERMTETYDTIKNLIYYLAHKHWCLFGGDIDDIIGDAHLLFVKSMQCYDPEVSPIAAWVSHEVRTGLLSKKRQEIKDQKREKNLTEYAHNTDNHTTCFDLIESLDDDVKELCSVLCSSWEGTVYERLRKGGWTYPRIWKTMEKVRALK